MKFWGEASTLDSFLKAYKASEMKGYFPYEWFEKLRKLFEFFFCQDAKTTGIFHLCTNFLLFFRICLQNLFEFLNICRSLEH